jgi:biotin transport system permease protein
VRLSRRRRGLAPLPSLVPAHAAGASWLHRSRAGAKLGVLVVLAAVAGVRTGPLLPAVLLAGVVAAAASARLPARPLLGSLRSLAPLALLLGLWALVSRGPAAAGEVVCDLAAAVLAAAVVSTTTASADLLDLVAAAARPLSRWGLPPERLALLLALTLRSFPHLAQLAVESRDAARARGLEHSVRAATVPLVLRTVEHAHALAEALAARGLGEAEPTGLRGR